MPRRRGRKTLRDTLLANEASSNFYATMAGKELPPKIVAIPAAPKKRIKKIPVRGEIDNSEASVNREITAVLKNHPRVLIAVRQNSGSLLDGNNVPIWFYRWIRRPNDMTITDFWGFTTDLKPFSIEAKNRKWKKVSLSNEREMKQLRFNEFIQKAGGKSGFATCAEDAIKILE